MKKTILVSVMLTALVAGASAQARDVKYMLPLDTTLAAPEVKGRIDNAVKLYFGNQSHPEVGLKFNAEASAKKRIEEKDDVAACQQAFADALAQLQSKAQGGGADAIINITSYYKNGTPTVSETEIECHAGSKSVGLSLRGDLVKFAK